MKMKLFMAVALLGCALSASAQFTGSGSRTGNSARARVADTDPYDRFSLSYDNTHLGANDKLEGYFNGEDAMNLNGFGLEYIHGFSVSKTLPMFIETGIKFQIGFGSVSNDDYSVSGYYGDIELIQKGQQMSFSVPVNFTYRFPLGDQMNIAPYFGLNFKIHALGRMKEVAKFEDDDLQDQWDDEYADEIKWYSVFDKKDMGDKDATWNRFQMGWHIGAGFSYKAFYVGLQYGTDFISAFKYKKYAINTGNLAIKVGLNF